jgi:WD40 repeat protein/Tfp pilus assembly protein PilF
MESFFRSHIHPMKFRSLPFLLLAIFISFPSVDAQTLELKSDAAPEIELASWIMQTRFLPDGQQVMVADLDGSVRFYETKTSRLVRETRLRDAQKLLCLEVSSDGKRFITGSHQGKVQLWDTEKAQPEREVIADKSIVNAVAFSRDGRHFAAGGTEGRIRIWSADDGALLKEINPAAGDIVSLAFTPDGRHLIAGCLHRRLNSNGGEISIWKWSGGERVRSFPGAAGVRTLAISPDGKFLAAGSFRPTSKLYLLPTGEAQKVEAMTQALGESDEAGNVTVREIASGRLVGNINAELGTTALAFSPDNSVLACAGDHGLVLYDLVSESLLERGRYDTLNRVSALAFHPQESQIIIATEKKSLAEFGKNGLEKLLSPKFMAITSMSRDGARDGMASGAKITEDCGAITGGTSLELLSASTRQSAEDTRLWEISRRVFGNKEERSKVRADLEKLIAEFPRSAEARRVLAVFFESQNPARARSLLDEAIRADAECAACHRSLGDLFALSKMWKESVASYRRVLELNANYGLVRGRLADALGQQALKTINPDDAKSLQTALSLLEEAMRLRPSDPLHYSNMSTVYFFAGDFDASIRLLEAAIALRPDRARPYYNLGHSWREKGDKKKAVSAYKRYVALGEPGEEARVQRARKLIEDLQK